MIGIFDSGTGGLSVFREIRKILPGQKYLYYSDNAHCPYGEKSREYITERARKITEFLMGQGAEIIVVACNTATAAAIETLRQEYDIPFIGMEPAVKPAALNTKTGIVGVLATAGTLKGSKYLHTRNLVSGGVKVVENVGKGFVELVENGILYGPEAEVTVRKSLLPLLEEGADTIVLGCTHYPFLMDTIRKVADGFVRNTGGKSHITIIDPAPAVARHLLEVMHGKGIPQSDSSDRQDVVLYASGDDSTLEKTFRTIRTGFMA